MSVLSCLTVTLKDAEAEATFVEAFVRALDSTVGFPGLERLIASKVIGTDFTYHLHTEWESQDAMDTWQSNESYRAIRDTFNVDLVASIDMSRWASA